MKFARGILIAGGVFNSVMGIFFFNNLLLGAFLRVSTVLEWSLFHNVARIPMIQDPVYLMLIHGFGAGALILGATLIISARDPHRYQPFIFVDGLGRLLYGSVMVTYVFRYALMKVILVLGLIELLFAVSYLYLSWKLSEP